MDTEGKSLLRWKEPGSHLVRNSSRYGMFSQDALPKFSKDRDYLSNVLLTVPSHSHSSGFAVVFDQLLRIF